MTTHNQLAQIRYSPSFLRLVLLLGSCFGTEYIHLLCTRICTRTYASHDCLSWNVRRRMDPSFFARTDIWSCARASERWRKERKTEGKTQKRERETERGDRDQQMLYDFEQQRMMQRRDKKNRLIADGLFVCCLEDVRGFLSLFREEKGTEGREGKRGGKD